MEAVHNTLPSFTMAGEADSDVSLSDYVRQKSNSTSVALYREKCKEIGNIDPYSIPKHKWKGITTLLGGDLADSDIY